MSETSQLVPAPPPRRLSTFIGRRAEIADLRQQLTQARLVTLVGPGGCGKSRLAIEVAAQVGASFPAGVGFAELTPISDPSLVPEAVAAALGIPRSASDRLADLIGGARLLLVIDNAERLVSAVAALTERMLASCPGLVVVVTSREPLQVEGERCWRVPPMMLPPDGTPAEPASLAAYDAVRLFCARCAEQQRDFELTEGAGPLVAAICRRLDGMPLALELAAARVRAYGLSEVLRRLEDALRLLTRAPRGAVERHRTLRAALEWSHSLLDDSERRLFRRLALFVGTFDLPAVEAICASPDLPIEQIVDVLQRLVDKSLIATRPYGHCELRFSLMEVVRQYALERLEQAGEGALRARHARWYGELAASLYDGRVQIADRLERMSTEYDNVRLSLDRVAGNDPNLEATLVTCLRWFWAARGSIREACQAAVSAANRGLVPATVQASLDCEAANWSVQAGDIGTALDHAERAVSLLDRVEHPALMAWALEVRGFTKAAAGRGDAERDLEDSRALLGATTYRELLATVLNDLALVRLAAGRVAEALATADQIVPVMAAPDGRSHHAAWLHTYGVVLLAAGRVAEARDRLLEGLDEAVRFGNLPAAAALLQGLACVASTSGDAVSCLELAAAGRRCGLLAGLPDEDPPGTPTLTAERASQAVLSPRAAAHARARGAAMDLQAALQCARATRSTEPPAPLTPRKREIVSLVAEGLTNGQIARRLSISERTVDAHLEQVRNELGLRNRAQITAWAGRHLDRHQGSGSDPVPPAHRVSGPGT